VTLKKGEQVREMFGPFQAAVAKAVADALEEGVFGDLDVDDLVILASIYLAPEATDYNRIYRFNYGATKLALARALSGSPRRRPCCTRRIGRRTP
jgi:bifunctional enzyme Fae/Hps